MAKIASSAVPPSTAIRILNISIPLAIREQLVGDLVEEFMVVKVPEVGAAQAHLWFWKQTFLSSYEYLNKQPGGIMSFILSIIVFFAFILMAILLGGGVSMYVDFPFMLIITVTSIVFGITATSASDAKFALKLLVSEQNISSESQVIRAAQFLNVTGNTALFTGALTALIALLVTVQHIFHETMYVALKPGLSLLFLAMLYSSVIKVVCYVAEKRIVLAELTTKEAS
jgi:hypothetical protein